MCENVAASSVDPRGPRGADELQNADYACGLERTVFDQRGEEMS